MSKIEPNAKQAGRSASPFPVHRRRKNIAKLVVSRHKRLRDNGWKYIEVAAEHCPLGPNRRDELMHWFEMVGSPIFRHQADDILDRVPPRNWTADALGQHLRVSDTERAILRIYTIGSYQTNKAQRIKRRKEKRRLADKARREANGAKPREASFSQTKPWEAFGIKRRAWERRGKPDPTTQIRGQYTSLSDALEFASSAPQVQDNEQRGMTKHRKGLSNMEPVQRSGLQPAPMPVDGPDHWQDRPELKATVKRLRKVTAENGIVVVERRSKLQ